MSTPDARWYHQRFVAMVIKGEAAARDLTLQEVATRSGIDYQTLLRVVNLKRDLKVDQVGAIAAVFGMRASELMREAERRMAQESAAEQVIASADLSPQRKQAIRDALPTLSSGGRGDSAPVASPDQGETGQRSG